MGAVDLTAQRSFEVVLVALISFVSGFHSSKGVAVVGSITVLFIKVHVASMVVLDLVVVDPHVCCIGPCCGIHAATNPLRCVLADVANVFDPNLA